MKLIKKITKWLSVLLFILIGICIAIPYLYKNEIIEIIKKSANENLNAELDFKNVDISFLSTFPDLTAKINGLNIKGVDEFEGEILTDIESFEVHIDIKSIFFGDQYKVKSILLNNPLFNIKVNEDGQANYDIVKADSSINEEKIETESAPFSLALENIELKNATFIYNDDYYFTSFELTNFNHTSSIVLNGNNYNLKTISNINSLSLNYDGVNYLKNINTMLDCDINLAMNEESLKIEFKQNIANLSLLNLSFDGWLEMFDDKYDMDLSFQTNEPSLKDLISLIPGSMTEGFNDLKSDGAVALNGLLKGTYNDEFIPGFNLNISVKNGWFKYPELSGKVDNIFVNTSIKKNDGEDIDNLVVDLAEFKSSLGDNKLALSLNLRNPISDPNIKVEINSKLNLGDLKNYIPISEESTVSGNITSNLSCNGKLSDIENENYSNFKSSGALKINGLSYNKEGNVAIVDSMLFKFSNESLIMPFFEARLGENNFSAFGEINNAVEYYFKDDPLNGKFSISSTFFDFNELWIYESYDSVEITKYADISDSLVVEEENFELITIPTNISFDLDCRIDYLKYSDINLKNTVCEINLKKGKAKIQNLSSNSFGGEIKIDGSYFINEDEIAAIDMNFSLDNVSIEDLSSQLNTVEKMAPISKFSKGNISTKFSIKSNLNHQLSPIINTLNSSGSLQTKEITVINYPLLNKIGEELKIKAINQQKIKNINLNFLITDGLINIDTFDVNLTKEIKAKIAGGTNLENELNYNLLTNVSPSLMTNSGLLNKINSSPNLNTLSSIPIEMSITGTFKNPIIKTNIKDQFKQKAKDISNKVKESIKVKIKDEAQKIINEAQVKANEIIKNADLKAMKIRKEGNDLANKIRNETKNNAKKAREKAYELADKEVSKSKNLIEKKAKQLVAEKAKTKADEAENKAIDEGIKKAILIENKSENAALKVEKDSREMADKILKEAQEKADKIK